MPHTLLTGYLTAGEQNGSLDLWGLLQKSSEPVEDFLAAGQLPRFKPVLLCVNVCNSWERIAFLYIFNANNI